MVWFVIALGLFNADSHRQVFKHLQAYRRGLTPRRNALCEARRGLGIAPLHWLGLQVIHPLADQATAAAAFYRGMRLMAIDGFVLNIPDTPDNERAFGRPKSGRALGAFPQVRVLSLCEVGTHVMYRHLVKPCHRCASSMAGYLLRWLAEGMLLRWDRNFFSYKHIRQVLQRRAHLLAPVKSNLIFRPIEVLADGSYLSKVYPSAKHRAKDQDGIVVRIIEYTLDEAKRTGTGEVHRLLTTLLDAEVDPAETLLVLYQERWEEELTIDEIKTHPKEKAVLRSETPAGVVQEIEGVMRAHELIRTLMFEAAAQEGIDPRRLSLTGTLTVLRCRLPKVPKDAKDEAGRQQGVAEPAAGGGRGGLGATPRRNRIHPRVIKCKLSKWPKK
jgi:hypothetical protein